MSAATYVWSDSQIDAYRDHVAPVKRNWCNMVRDFIRKDDNLIFLAVLLAGGFCGSLLSKDWSNGVAIGVMISIITYYLTMILLGTFSHRIPNWKIYSLPDFLDLDDEDIPGTHPLRKAIVEARQRHPEAEFVIEYLEASSKSGSYAKDMILWMQPSPFESNEQEAILVLDGTNTITPPKELHPYSW